MRNPCLIDRGWWLDFGRFLCASRSDSITWYSGSTALEAYEFWAKSTRPGREHKLKRGFKHAIIREHRPCVTHMTTR